MINEVSAKPMHPSNSLPDWERSEQKDSTEHMISDVQITHSEKENKRSFPQRIKSVIHQNLMMQNMVEHKMRFLVGEVNGKNECFHYSVKEGTWLSTPISW